MWKFLINSRPAGTAQRSPTGQYVAVVGPPQEVWGNQLADWALWTAAVPGQLLYYRAGYLAHALSPAQPPVFFYWSRDGEWLTFYEVKRQDTYQLVFLHLPARQAYRVPATDELLRALPTLSAGGAEIQLFLQNAQASASPLTADAAVPAGLRPR